MNKKLGGYYKVDLSAAENDSMNVNDLEFKIHCLKNNVLIVKVILGWGKRGTFNDPQPTEFPYEREPDNWYQEYYIFSINDSESDWRSLYEDEIEQLIKIKFLKKIRRNSKLYVLCEL
jgi:hypothetical protein